MSQPPPLDRHSPGNPGKDAFSLLQQPKIFMNRIGISLAVCLALFFCAGLFSGCTDEPARPADGLHEARQAFARKEFLDAERQYELYLQQHPEGTQRWEAWERLVDIALSIRQSCANSTAARARLPENCVSFSSNFSVSAKASSVIGR